MRGPRPQYPPTPVCVRAGSSRMRTRWLDADGPFRCRLTNGRAPAVGDGSTKVRIDVLGPAPEGVSRQSLDDSSGYVNARW